MKLFHSLIIATALSSLISCAEKPLPQTETRECIEYRNMMTAPMSPAAAEELRKKCEWSRQ